MALMITASGFIAVICGISMKNNILLQLASYSFGGDPGNRWIFFEAALDCHWNFLPFAVREIIENDICLVMMTGRIYVLVFEMLKQRWTKFFKEGIKHDKASYERYGFSCAFLFKRL